MRESEQMQKMKTQPGFVAALDQSGGSTPHALVLLPNTVKHRKRLEDTDDAA